MITNKSDSFVIKYEHIQKKGTSKSLMKTHTHTHTHTFSADRFVWWFNTATIERTRRNIALIANNESSGRYLLTFIAFFTLSTINIEWMCAQAHNSNKNTSSNLKKIHLMNSRALDIIHSSYDSEWNFLFFFLLNIKYSVSLSWILSSNHLTIFFRLV